ncbi:hypothetical protein U1Q18_011802 [Sarracenia purpurea var. burkii]
MKVVPSRSIKRVFSSQAHWDLVDTADNPTLAPTLHAAGSTPPSVSAILSSDVIALLSFQAKGASIIASTLGRTIVRQERSEAQVAPNADPDVLSTDRVLERMQSGQ